MDNKTYDVIVAGGGPAGYTAAMYAARSGYTVAVVEQMSAGGQMATTETVENYPVNLFFTREGYFKKITPQSYRMSSEQYLKEGDQVVQHVEGGNADNLLFFTDRGQVYKAKACDFEDTKASVLGDFVPAKLGMDEGESAIAMAVTADYQGYMLFCFENGKVAKVNLNAYETKGKTDRRAVSA